jgi:RNA polymerase sigma-70 factor (ECF subfamily)
MLFNARRAPREPQQATIAHDVPEREWVERIRAGDEAACAAMFTHFYAALCDFVDGYVRAPDVAEEIVQTVFLRVWERRASWDPAGGVRAYLFAACRNHALDHLKHERIVGRCAGDAVRDDEAPAHGAPTPRPDEYVQADELTRALQRAVDALPERRRLVVILRWRHQLTNAEIARVLGISLKGVEMQFSRALASLRKRLSAFRR